MRSGKTALEVWAATSCAVAGSSLLAIIARASQLACWWAVAPRHANALGLASSVLVFGRASMER